MSNILKLKSFYNNIVIVLPRRRSYNKMSQTQVNQTSESAVTRAIENLTVTQLPPKNQVMPPRWFNINQIYNYEMVMQIAKLTNNFTDVPREVRDKILLNERPFSSYGTIPAPPVNALVKQIIGSDGYYLKITTQNSGVDFIWHDRERNEFQFWGEYTCCVNAMNVIRSRICKYVDMYKVKQNPTPYVFVNDIKPHPAVCYESIVAFDNNGENMRTLASKGYPEISA